MFCSKHECLLYLPTMYIYCVWSSISKSPKQLPNFLNRAETSLVQFFFQCDIYHICVYTITSVFTLSHLCLHYHICVYTITSVFTLSHLCLHYHICVYTITSYYQSLYINESKIKMKNKKYHTVGPIPKSNIKIVERGKIDNPNTQIHDCSLSWLPLGTCTLIKSGGVRRVLWVQTSPVSEITEKLHFGQ